MIGDRNKTGPDVLPGRLKVVTIGLRVTIAFAGDADPAGVVIRAARRALHSAGVLSAIEVLQRASRGGGTDFLVAFHNPEASLVRLRKGVSLDVKDICVLGHDEPFRDLIDRAKTSTGDKPLRNSDLRFGFIDRLLTGKHLPRCVGGFPMAVEATPTGHRYLGCVGTYTYRFPEMRWGEETHQPIEQVYTGDGHFTLSVIPSEAVDVPVVGACLLQARMGYVFSPMEQPEAFSVRLGPPESLWEGQEQQMYTVLKQALAAHVAAITQSDG